MVIKAVLFDIDGTLIDSNELHVTAWQQAFAEAGHQVGASAIRGQIGKGGDNLVPALVPGADAVLVKALSAGHGRLFKALFLRQANPFPNARALLQQVHDDGRKVVLASSASKEELEHYIGVLDAAAIVAAGTSIDDVETSKPAPDIFAAALKKAGVAADEAVVVGDTPYDVASAAGAGIGTVAVLSGGFDEQALRDAGATAIYRDVAALLAGYGESPLSK